jgi:CheY-like chemotaxis protein
VNHLRRLVDDLLDISRAARGGLQLERVPVELSAIVADAIEVVRPTVAARHHMLTVSVSGTSLVVNGDPGRLAQVVINLLNNAAKYTPPGGTITVSAGAKEDWITLEVADDGSGIAPDLLPRIFDAFAQGRQGLDRKQGGLGLGLAIARQLVIAHGGTIEAKSAGPGQGTSLLMRLPRAQAAQVPAPASVDVTRPQPRQAGRRVLLVDDNADVTKLLGEALVMAGHEVRTVADGPSALLLVETFVPDIAFLDIGLPEMDGYELADRLRRIPRLEQTLLVAMTGYAQESDRRRALASGFGEHLPKPFHFQRVLECVERLSAPS